MSAHGDIHPHADWGLSDPPADVPGLKSPMKWGLELSDYELIRREGEVAREHHADCVLVVGRIFSSPLPSRDVIAGAIRAIAEIELPVILVPGGLDDGASGSVWEDGFFMREAARWAPNLRVLLASEPVEQEGCLLCPLLSRGSVASFRDDWAKVCGRIAANGRWSRPLSGRPIPRIMILPNAAGADDDNSATLAFLDDAVLAEIDYVALAGGDGIREVAPKAWQSGSPARDTSRPTVDDLDRHEACHAAVVDVALRGMPPHVAAALERTTARGRMTVFLGAIILAGVPFSLRVDAARAADRPRLEPERAGEAWDDRLLELITEADVFQLFWSQNAMASPHVRREWEHALSLGRDNFIRPVYWESPLPRANGLPPEPLTRIHFQFIGAVAATGAEHEETG